MFNCTSCGKAHGKYEPCRAVAGGGGGGGSHGGSGGGGGEITGVARAVANSPPPLGDVGDDVSHMMDEGMGMMKGDEIHVTNICHYCGRSGREEHKPDCALLAATTSAMEQRHATVATLLSERKTTHGRFEDNAAVGQALRELFRGRDGWEQLTDMQREALDMIAGKISRILSGQGGFQDHWDDIAGYAKIALGQRD